MLSSTTRKGDPGDADWCSAAERGQGLGVALRRRLKVWFAVAVLLLLVVAVRLGGQDRLIERRFIFFPERELVATPADWGLSFQDVYFTTSDGVRLHGWFVPGEGELTWLWFHGNAGNISHRLENLTLLHDRLGVSILLFDYRGYGRSEGHISEEGSYRDAEAALAYLRSRPDVDADKIVLFGRSLGCAIATDLATRHQVYRLILESPFTSVPDMANRTFPLLPVGLLMKTKYDSLAKIKAVTTPLLVLHGDRDETVPIKFARRLFQAANDPKEFSTIAGAGHNDTYAVGGEAYFATLRRFVEGDVQSQAEEG